MRFKRRRGVTEVDIWSQSIQAERTLNTWRLPATEKQEGQCGRSLEEVGRVGGGSLIVDKAFVRN